MSQTNPGPSYDGLPSPRLYLAIGVLLLTLVLVVLDVAIANIALPSIAVTLDASPGDAVWVVSSYQLAVLIALLPCGVIGEMLGARRVFLVGVAIFTLGSLACAFSDTLPILVAARFVQGLGGGAIMALGIMNLRYSVPRRMLGTIIGINAMTIAVTSAAGPGIAGAILAVAPWPWLFAVNVPIGIIVLAFGTVMAPTIGAPRRLDGKALVANTLMFVLFFCGADRIAVSPISGTLMIAGSALCLLTLLKVERRNPAPLVPVDLLARPAFRASVIASVCCFAGQMLSLIALPFYLQQKLGMTPTEAALYMMPWPAAVALIAPISGRLANRIKTAWLCAAGGAMQATGLALICLSPAGVVATAFIGGTVLAGLGFGLFQTPNNRVLLLSAPMSRSGAAGAMQGTARLTGQTLGAIVMAIIFGVLEPANAPEVALAYAAIFAGLGAAVSLGRARHEAASCDQAIENVPSPARGRSPNSQARRSFAP